MTEINLYNGKYTGSEVDELLTKVNNGVIISNSDKATYDSYGALIDELKNKINCIGEIKTILCSASYVPDGCVKCDGATYNQSQYSDFWVNYLGNGYVNNARLKCCDISTYKSRLSTFGQCPMIGIDIDNKQFRVPLIKDGTFIQQAYSDSELGKAYNAGLPNITGTFTNSDDKYATGAFGVTDTVKGTDSGSKNQYVYDFDAKRCSNVYGNSTTVQPQSVAIRYFICLVNGTFNESKMNWDEYQTALENKANIDLSNVTETMIKNAIGKYYMGVPNYKSRTEISWNTTYTASSNGWLYVWAVRESTSVGSITIYIDDVPFEINSNDYADQYIMMPIGKKSIYKVYYSGSGLTHLNVYWISCV